MKISEIQNISLNEMKFSVNREKLNKIWELVLKIYNSGEKLDPWCSMCDNGRIKKESSTGFGYTTDVCECLNTSLEVNRIIDELGISWVTYKMLQRYSPEWYTEGMYSLQDTEKLLNKDWWLFIHGDVGTGKTFMAFVSLVLSVCSWYSVFYANVPKLLEQLRPWESKDDSLLETLCSVDFLILDDIGQEKYSEWVLERLYIIINERYINEKKTVITSNLSIEKLENKLSHKPIISRIKWSSTMVEFIWFDKRK